MSGQREKYNETAVPPEIEYLISDIEELVDREVDIHLDGQPFSVKVTDYMPPMQDVKGNLKPPIGVTRIDRDIMQTIAPSVHEFTGMDMLLQFPISNTTDNPLNIALKWSDGMCCRLAVVDRQPILLVERGDESEEVLWAATPSAEQMTTYLNSIGLPDSLWLGNIKNLIEDIGLSRDIRLIRRVTEQVDIGSTLEICHDARYMTNDMGDKELVQELCLNIDHQSEGRVGDIFLPGHKVYRNMLRFERSDDGNSWQYRGAYSGKLEAGEFIDELVQIEPKLGVPSSKVIDKALGYLSQRPF